MAATPHAANVANATTSATHRPGRRAHRQSRNSTDDPTKAPTNGGSPAGPLSSNTTAVLIDRPTAHGHRREPWPISSANIAATTAAAVFSASMSAARSWSNSGTSASIASPVGTTAAGPNHRPAHAATTAANRADPTTDGSRHTHGSARPVTRSAAASTQYVNGGLRRYTSPLRCGTSQSPDSTIWCATSARCGSVRSSGASHTRYP